MRGLHDKVALIAGDIDVDKAQALADELDDDAIALHYDAADHDTIEAMVEAVVAHYGRIDILHNNAALTTPLVMDADLSVTDIAFDTWNAVLNVNITGYMAACKFAVPHMIAGGGGSIINIASGSGLVGDLVRTA